MNWDQIAGRWAELRGRVLQQWGKLTADDLDVIAGKREQLVGILQRRYGAAREAIEVQVKEFERRLSDEKEPPLPT